MNQLFLIHTLILLRRVYAKKYPKLVREQKG